VVVGLNKVLLRYLLKDKTIYIIKKRTMNDELIDTLFELNTQLSKCKNAREFFKKGLHLKFEKADLKNRVDWFNKAKKKYGDCMLNHAIGVYGVFDMDNYWTWYEKEYNKERYKDADVIAHRESN